MESKNGTIDNCDGYKLITVATSIAIFLAENLSLDDQNVLGNLIVGVGQNLLIIAAQNSKYNDCVNQSTNNEISNKDSSI